MAVLRKKYLVVAMDYFTKRVEEKPKNGHGDLDLEEYCV